MKRLHVSFGVADLEKSVAGIRWEAFHTLHQMETFGTDRWAKPTKSARPTHRPAAARRRMRMPGRPPAAAEADRA